MASILRVEQRAVFATEKKGKKFKILIAVYVSAIVRCEEWEQLESYNYIRGERERDPHRALAEGHNLPSLARSPPR